MAQSRTLFRVVFPLSHSFLFLAFSHASYPFSLFAHPFSLSPFLLLLLLRKGCLSVFDVRTTAGRLEQDQSFFLTILFLFKRKTPLTSVLY
jgi:hypothetical protein